MTTQKIKLNSRYQLNNERTSDSYENFTKLWIARYKVNDKDRNKNISWETCKLKGKLKATLLQLLFDAKALNKKIKDGRIFKALL